MQTYSGRISMIGNGTWIGEPNGEGGTKLSVLEVGDKILKRIYLPDYLANYITVGTNARLLVYKDINKHGILAVEVGGKKYKSQSWPIWKFSIVTAVLFCMVFWFLFSTFIAPALHIAPHTGNKLVYLAIIIWRFMPLYGLYTF